MNVKNTSNWSVGLFGQHNSATISELLAEPRTWFALDGSRTITNMLEILHSSKTSLGLM